MESSQCDMMKARDGGLQRKTIPHKPFLVALLVFLLLAVGAVPVLGTPIQKDVAAGDENSYLYGKDADELLVSTDTATSDVNGDGIPDLIMGHDQGGTGFPYLYTGKIYVYYGRTSLDLNVDLGVKADVTINGYYAGFAGNSLACGDVNGDGMDDIIIGCSLDSPAGASYAGGVAIVFGSHSLPAAWDFNVTPPDLYLSSANGGEQCGISLASGDVDGDGFDDVLFGANLGNGGVHFNDGTAAWTDQGRAGADSLYDISMIDSTHGWAVGKYVSAYDTLYYWDGSSWDKDTFFDHYKINFNGVAAYATDHVWAVGQGGTIAFRNGSSWSDQTSGVAAELRDALAIDANNVWAVGDAGTILKTSNGGVGWGTQASGTSANLRGISSASASAVWAVGDSGTIRYFNGTSWGMQVSGTSSNLRAVSAVDASHVWAVGDGGTILFYNGSSWSSQVSNVYKALRGVSAVDANTAWAVGDAGTILKTTDGGNHWQTQSVLFSQQLNAVDALDSTHAWTTGEAATGRAYMVWGRSAGWPAWSYMNPIRPNVVINGVEPFDSAGFPVSLGDINGDGKADIVIGARDANGPGNARPGCGEAYMVYGRSQSIFPSTVNLAFDSNCTIYGATAMDRMPDSLSRPLKDINGDHYADILFGMASGDGPGDARPGCGEMDAVFGGNLPSQIDLATSAPNLMVYGAVSGGGVGFSVEALDFNGDRLTDLACGSPSANKGAERSHCGAAWLVNGRSSWPAQIDLATSSDMVFYGAESGDDFGFCLSSANLNGDAKGYDDLVITDFNGKGPDNARPKCGEHFIFLGYDIIPPTCAITNVANGSVLCGTVGVEVTVYDYHGISRVEFWLDGALKFADTAAPYRWDFDTRSVPDGTSPVIEARAYDASGNSASDSRTVKINNTVPPLSRTWYLAEGCTAWGFETYVLVQNPNPSPTTVTFTFMKPGGTTQNQQFDLAGNSRFTFLVNSFIDQSDVSTKVEGSQPIICERAMYYTPAGSNRRVAGGDSTGVTNASSVWYLAEGTTAWGFEEYVLVQNPNPQDADVTMTFMKPGGATQSYSFALVGQSRYTVNVNQLVDQADVSTKVEASEAVICERSMYRYDKDLCTQTTGTPSSSRQWYLAEGTTAWGFDEYVLVQNPNPQSAVVDFEFMLPDGGIVPYGVVLAGLSRFTVHVNTVPGCEKTDLSTYVKSDQPVICERAMYWQGASSHGGHGTIGTPLPSTHWYLAEGTTAWGFEEYVLVQNPNDATATASFTFMRPDGSTVFLSLPVAAKSRFSLKANDVVPNCDISTSVASDLPIICERAMYLDQRNIGTCSIGVRGED